MEVPMHQDGNYWPIRPLTTCTVWIALDESDRENGCLKGVCVCVCVCVLGEEKTQHTCNFW